MKLPTLLQALREDHEATMLRQAEMIRQWPIECARREQAMIHVRLALWEEGMGRISAETQHLIYSILSFVMPGDAAFIDEPTPIAELERAADSEQAYFEQLARQSCQECGDGVCPVEREASPESTR